MRMTFTSHRMTGLPGWLVANCVLVTLMVLVVVFAVVSLVMFGLIMEYGDWEPESVDPIFSPIFSVFFWMVIVGGPVSLVLCCLWLHKIDKTIQRTRLRVVFFAMNFVGIGLSLVASLMSMAFVLNKI
jgi:hypothetical protein